MNSKQNNPKQMIDVLLAQNALIDAKQSIENALALLESFLVGGYKKGISTSVLVEAVCSVVGVTSKQIKSKSRKQKVVTARHIYSQIAVNYLSHDMDDSMNFIDRDRSTYYNNNKKHCAYYGVEDEYTSLYNEALQKIKELENDKANSEGKA